MMDLSNGFDAYVAALRYAGSEQIKKCGNLERRLEREVGPLRLEMHLPVADALNQLLIWKLRRYLRSGSKELMAIGWIRAVIREIHETRTTSFAGLLSALYAGDRIVAAHFGMRSATVMHYWFPGYDPTLAKYSPGIILLLKMAESDASAGLKTVKAKTNTNFAS